MRPFKRADTLAVVLATPYNDVNTRSLRVGRRPFSWENRMTLRIERALTDAGGAFSEKFQLMKHRLLNTEYEHWAAGFSTGNNHGRGHIVRVLEHLDQLL